MSAPVIGLENLTVSYDRHPAVHHLSGSFARGSLTAVIGPNGAGKSTLLKAIVGFLKPDEGRIVRHLADPGREIAYLPQLAEIDREFPITVEDFAAAGAWGRCGGFRGVSVALRREVEAALAAVGMETFARRGIGTLSGGQFQRVLFARLILQDAPVILLDEPFAAIDTRTVADLMGLVSAWHRAGRTVIAVLHELDLVRTHFPQALLLMREAVAWGPTPEVLTRDHLASLRDTALRFEENADVCAEGLRA